MAQTEPKSHSMELSDFSNANIVTLAIASLGGASTKIHTEEIAERALELAPDRFSWRLKKYQTSGWPQIYIVKTALTDAEKKANGGYITGNYATDLSKDGWSLTPEGAAWTRGRMQLLEGQTKYKNTIPKAEKQRVQKYLNRVKRQPIYREYVKQGSLQSASVYAFADLLNVSPDASRSVISKKFNSLASQANMYGDRTLNQFIDECAKQFGQLMEA